MIWVLPLSRKYTTLYKSTLISVDAVSFMTDQTEKKLVLNAQKNQVFFSKLYERYHDKIHRYINNKVSNESVAEDLTGDVFEKALTHISTFKWKGLSFGSWLYRIARNRVYDYYRSSHRNKTSAIPDHMKDSIAADSGSDDKAEHDERELTLYSVIAGLDEKDQYLLYYRYFEGMSVKAVARKVGLSDANVATRLHRIRAQLKGTLKDEGEV